MNKCWILWDAFPASVETNIWFFFFVLFNCINLYSNKLTLYFWNKYHLITMIILFLCCWAQFDEFCSGLFCLPSRQYWSVVILFCNVSFWFWYQSNSGLIKQVCKRSLPLFSKNSCIRLVLFLSFWENSSVTFFCMYVIWFLSLLSRII